MVYQAEEWMEWLKQMDKIGAGDQHRSLVASQIALILRDLELIDQNRANKVSARFKSATPSRKVTTLSQAD